MEQTLEVLVQAGTGFHHSQMLLTEGNGTQTIRRGSDTAELCTTCPCTPRAPSNIEAFPSAIVKSLKITALQKKISSPQRAEPHLQSELFSPGQNRPLDSISCPGPLETSCRHVLRAAPFPLQRSRFALPPVICTLSAPWTTCQQLRTRTVFSCSYAALLTE